MDMSTILGALLSDSGVSSMGKKSNTDSAQVQDVVTMALPYLLKGLTSQADNADTMGSLITALGDHGKKDSSDLGTFFENVDLEDGEKVVGHLLGDEKEDVAQDIAEKSGIDTAQVIKLLAAAAPLIMTLVGTQTQKKSQEAAAKPKPATTSKPKSTTTSKPKSTTTAKPKSTAKPKPAAKPKKEEAAEEPDSADVIASILGDVLKGLLK